MASGQGPKRATLVCCTMGACFGGFIGSLLGGVWAPPAAAFGATLGGKAAGTVR